MLTRRLIVPAIIGLALVVVAPTGALAQDTPAAPATTNAALPSGKQVLEDALKAVGGKAAIERIKSARVLAQLESPVGTSTMEMFWTKRGASLIRSSLPGMGTFEQGTDGTHRWGTNPRTGQLELMQGRQFPVPLAERTSMHLMVPRMMRDFGAAKTLDRREFAGRSCYMVILSQPKRSGEPDRAVYFDVKTRLPVAIEVTVATPAGNQVTTTTIESWLERDGVKLAERFVTEGGGQPRIPMRLLDAEFNKVDPKVVALPESLREQVGQTGR